MKYRGRVSTSRQAGSARTTPATGVLLVGRVQHIYLPDDVLRPDGSLDLVGAGTVCVSGLDAYHTVLPPVRFAYARAGKGPQPLPG